MVQATTVAAFVVSTTPQESKTDVATTLADASIVTIIVSIVFAALKANQFELGLLLFKQLLHQVLAFFQARI